MLALAGAVLALAGVFATVAATTGWAGMAGAAAGGAAGSTADRTGGGDVATIGATSTGVGVGGPAAAAFTRGWTATRARIATRRSELTAMAMRGRGTLLAATCGYGGLSGGWGASPWGVSGATGASGATRVRLSSGAVTITSGVRIAASGGGVGSMLGREVTHGKLPVWTTGVTPVVDSSSVACFPTRPPP